MIVNIDIDEAEALIQAATYMIGVGTLAPNSTRFRFIKLVSAVSNIVRADKSGTLIKRMEMSASHGAQFNDAQTREMYKNVAKLLSKDVDNEMKR